MYAALTHTLDMVCDPTTTQAPAVDVKCCVDPHALAKLARERLERAVELTSAEEVAPPWVFSSERHSILEAECRRRIEICASMPTTAFLSPLLGSQTPPADFNELPDLLPVGRAALRESPALTGLRQRIVPASVTDEGFWFCFFAHANAVRKSVLPPPPQKEASVIADDEFDQWLAGPFSPGLSR